MYAVIRAGGKQFRVAPGDVIKVSGTAADENGRVQFADVLAISAEAGKIGKPNDDGASVTGQVVEEGRAKKVLVFKFKRKKQYKKMQGHRQAFTAVRITEIAYDGQKASAPDLPAKKARAKRSDPAIEAAPAAVAKSAGRKSASKKAAVKKSAAKKSGKKK